MDVRTSRDVLLRRSGGVGDFSPLGAGPFAPPIFSFPYQKEKRKRAVHGPKEKRKYWGMRTLDEGAAGVLPVFYECLLPTA